MNHQPFLILYILISVLSGSLSGTQAAPVDIDDWIQADLSNEEIYGVVIAIVEDGRIQYLSGYGSVDKEGEWPLDPRTTRIPIGSVTKLFTWEALEQLIYDGRIDPDEDLNNYLPYPTLKTESEPITATDLITHTTGLDERIAGIFTRDLSEIPAPFNVFVKNQPEQIRSPGIIAAYSNTGALLAGAVIALSSTSSTASVARFSSIRSLRNSFKALITTPCSYRSSFRIRFSWLIPAPIWMNHPFACEKSFPAPGSSSSARIWHWRFHGLPKALSGFPWPRSCRNRPVAVRKDMA